MEMNVNNTFAMQTGLEKGDLSWGSPHFFQMVQNAVHTLRTRSWAVPCLMMPEAVKHVPVHAGPGEDPAH